MSYEQVLYDVRDRVATITMNRPERLNAWTPLMGRELYDAFQRAGSDPEVRVVIVTGAGRGFCAGADMDNLRSIQDGRVENQTEARQTRVASDCSNGTGSASCDGPNACSHCAWSYKRPSTS